jgi:hypothetical protein
MTNLIRSVFLLLLLSGCGWDGTPTRQNDFVPLTSIEISADSAAIVAQTSIKLTVNGNFSGLFPRDVTNQAVWSSDSPAVAGFVTASDRSRVTGLKPGAATLTATVGGVTSAFTLTVSSGTVTALTITPVDPIIPKGRAVQFTATGVFSDLPPRDITFDVAWASSAPDVATVSDAASSKGFARALAVGKSTISATFDRVIGSTVMTVTEPALQTIALSLTNPSILTLSKTTFKATGTNTDGSTPDITSQVSWNSSNTAIATIAGDGTVTALTQGTTTISATLGSVSQSTTLKATGGNLTGITVTPATVTLVKDISGLISAKGAFDNGSIRDITGAVTWTAANTALASVTPSGGNLALLKPLAVTLVPTTITATSGTRTGTATLTVIAPQLSSIAFSTTTLDLTVGTSIPLAVTATFNDGRTQDVTSISIWTPGNPTIAAAAAGGLGTERVTGIAAGTTTISATYGGKTVLAPATVTVRARTLQSLTILPVTSTAAAGSQIPIAATANYGDNTTVDLTKENATVWSIDNPNIAILADSVNQPGLVVAVDRGSATLTASFGGKTQTATITITGP